MKRILPLLLCLLLLTGCGGNTIYQHIIPQLGKIPLCQLTQKDLQQFYAHLKKEGRLVRTEQFGKGLSDRMVRMCHAKCRAALDQAVQENLILLR